MDGKIIDTPALTVSGNEKILVDGEKIPQIEHPRLWLYHKPT